jgi:hypothetical protein
MSEATMTRPDDDETTAAASGPVGHTDARHKALLSVRDGMVAYDREHATWLLRPAGGRQTAVRGARQRTLRDLLDLGLIVTSGSDRRKARLTPQGQGAVALWGERPDRL